MKKISKAELLKYIDETYIPEKTSMGNELYSGTVDARSFRFGWEAAKSTIVAYLRDVL